jgi:hypothetical protein
MKIFSPAGSNIDAGKKHNVNTHCFVGYFTNFMSIPYNVTITHPATLWGSTSMTDLDTSTTDTLLPLVMPNWENQSCIQNRITQHLQLTDGNPY